MRKFILYAWLCTGMLASALAGTHKVPRDEPLAVMQIPDRWQTKEHEERVEAASPDGALRFLILQPEPGKVAESVGEVMRYIRNTGGIIVKAESVKHEVGGLTACPYGISPGRAKTRTAK